MALMSATERFNAIMNGEDFESESTPNIDVEINVIQKEIEAEEAVDEVNDVQNEMEDTADTTEQVEDAVDEAEMLVKILRSDGIDPISLKILSTNRTYTDIWKITMPSTESLDVHGTNKRAAEQLAVALESRIEAAREGIKSIYNNMVDKLGTFWEKIKNAILSNKKRVEAMRSKVNGLELDSEKCESKKAKGYDLATTQGLAKIVSDMVKLELPSPEGKGAAKFNNAYQSIEERITKFMSESAKTEIEVSSISKSITSDGDKFYAAAVAVFDSKDACATKVKELKEYFSGLTKAAKDNDELSKDEKKDVKRANANTMKYLSKISKVISAVQSNYVKLATAVYDCRISRNEKAERAKEAETAE